MVLNKYFLVDVSPKQPSILHYKTYKKISDLIKPKYILKKIHSVGAVADMFNWFFVLFQKDEPLIHRLHLECVLLVFAIMGRFLEWEVYAELAAKELPGTRIACCNQLHEKELVFCENCESTFVVLFSELKSEILNGARSVYEDSLRHLIKKSPLENIILWCCKAVHLWEMFEYLARN